MRLGTLKLLSGFALGIAASGILTPATHAFQGRAQEVRAVKFPLRYCTVNILRRTATCPKTNTLTKKQTGPAEDMIVAGYLPQHKLLQIRHKAGVHWVPRGSITTDDEALTNRRLSLNEPCIVDPRKVREASKRDVQSGTSLGFGGIDICK